MLGSPTIEDDKTYNKPDYNIFNNLVIKAVVVVKSIYSITHPVIFPNSLHL